MTFKNLKINKCIFIFIFKDLMGYGLAILVLTGWCHLKWSLDIFFHCHM